MELKNIHQCVTVATRVAVLKEKAKQAERMIKDVSMSVFTGMLTEQEKIQILEAGRILDKLAGELSEQDAINIIISLPDMQPTKTKA
jgi:hypothetical protein